MKFSKKFKSFEKHMVAIEVVLLFIFVIAALYLWESSIQTGAEALAGNRATAFASEKEDAYQRWYDSAFERAEERYHSSNFLAINIGSFEESNKLEVLKVNDVEFIVENREDNSGNITAWLEVTGEGTFTVDLQAAEFIVDNQRQHVQVRAIYPELDNVTIIKAEMRLFRDDWMNGSYSEGVDLALKQRNEASLRIQKALTANQYIHEQARVVAERAIINLVKQFNPGNTDLVVEVEFVNLAE